MGYSEYLAALVASFLVSGTLAAFFWQRHPASGARFLAILAGMICLWSLGYIIEVVIGTTPGFLLASDIEYISYVSVPVWWFVFTAEYTGYRTWPARRWPLLLIIPSITLVLVWTNNLHGWMWHSARLQAFGEFVVQVKTYGPWFWVYTVYSYGLMLAGIAVLATRLFGHHRLFRDQAIVLLTAVVLPLAWNTIYIFKAAPTYHVDMTPPAFAVSGLIIAVGLFRFNILKTVPIARNTVIDNMDDGVIVIDRQNLILDFNKGAEKITGYPAPNAIGKPARHVLAKLPEWPGHIGDSGKFQTEIVVEGTDGKNYYELCLFPLFGRGKALTARVMTLHDITRRKRGERALAAANEQLKQYASRITRAQEEERKRVAYELHDGTAQYLSILKMQIGALASSDKIESPEIVEKLRVLETDADRAFNDVRRYSHELRPVILEHHGLVAALEQIAADHNKLGEMSIQTDIKGMEPELSEEIKVGFFRIAQEALNNIRKHAKASQAVVRLKFEDSRMEMEVSDNGIGFDIEEARNRSANSGSLGLISMRERAELINADLKIETGPGKGTKIILKARV